MSRYARTTIALALVTGFVAVAAPSLANTFACCLPDGGCQDTLMITCDDLGGASLVGRSCSESPCVSSAPLLSPLGMLVMLTGFTAIAIYGLQRRRAGAR